MTPCREGRRNRRRLAGAGRRIARVRRREVVGRAHSWKVVVVVVCFRGIELWKRERAHSAHNVLLAARNRYKVRSRGMMMMICRSSAIDAYALELGCVAEDVWLQTATNVFESRESKSKGPDALAPRVRADIALSLFVRRS